MSRFFVAKRKAPPTYAFTIWRGDFTKEEERQFDKVILQDEKYWLDKDIKTWYDIYEIDGEFYTIGRTKGHTIFLQNFMKCYCNDYKTFREQLARESQP